MTEQPTIDDFLERLYKTILELERGRNDMDRAADDSRDNDMKTRLRHFAQGLQDARERIYSNFPEMLNYSLLEKKQ